MSGTQISGKAVTSSSSMSVRTGTTIPPTPAVPRRQIERYGAKAVTFEGIKSAWRGGPSDTRNYKSNIRFDTIFVEQSPLQSGLGMGTMAIINPILMLT
ncbi:hypothetical protein KY284_011260 [Solanum tuberosum]|nr:hypothetical protein KY284_011260 [Solanum tuberosum]